LEEQARLICGCLDAFCAISGQKVNLHKSRVTFSANTDDNVKSNISAVLGYTAVDDLGMYLGVPALSKRVTKATFQCIVDRVEKRLSGWRTKCLSLAGRVTLIKSTLTSIPAYVMQTCRLPRATCDELDRKVRRFLWAGTNLDRKPHLVAWATVTKSLEEGGLGIRSMRSLNSAAMVKLGWRMMQEPEALWARVLKYKYSKKGNGIHYLEPGRKPSNAWKGICEMSKIL